MEKKEQTKVNNTQYSDKAQQVEQEISITQILGIIKQRRIWIYVFFVLVMGLAIFYLQITNPTYEASATALVEPISNATSIESLLTSSTSSTKIDTEIQLITSSSNLKDALDRLDLNKYKNPDGVPYSELDLEKSILIGSFAKKVSVTTVSSTKVVKLTVSDGNPQFCADYANAVVAAYTDLLTRISKNSKSAQREFLESQIPETEALLAQASQNLADYKEQSGIMQMTQKNTLLTSKISAFQLEMGPLKLQLVELQSLMDSLNADGSLPSWSDVAGSAEVKGLLDEYVSNSMELLMYQNVDSETSSSRVYVLESNLSSKAKDVLNAVTNIVGQQNATYAKAVTDYICGEASIKAIEKIIEIYNEELSDYPIMEREYLEKQRDVEIYEALLLSLRQLLEETKMVEAAVVGNVNVIDSASAPENPVSPKKMMILAVAVVGGVVIGILFGLFLEFIDDKVKSEDSIKQILGQEVPALGWTPYIKNANSVKKKIPSLFVLNDPDCAVSERFKSIANNIVYSLPEKIQVISINSTEMGEGKTTAICNVAAAYAMSGKKVLLIDGDFRMPAIEPFFNLRRSKFGLVDSIMDDAPLEKCIVRPLPELPNLHILPPGKGTRNPNALYNSEKTEMIFKRLRLIYDFIIIDCPPISYGSEFTHLARHLDGFVLNIRAGVSSKRALRSLMVELDFVNAPLLGYIYYGVISRNQSQHSGSYYANKHYGYYGYSHGKSIYEEGKGSYSIIYKKELHERTRKAYGNIDPVLAFSGGLGDAFRDAEETRSDSVKPVVKPVAPVEVKDETRDEAKAEPKEAVRRPVAKPASKPGAKPASKPASRPMSDADKKTFEMLAEIENLCKKK